MDTNQIRLLDWVLLETEWVLRSLYEYDRERVHAGLSAVIGLRQVRVETPQRVAQALVWFDQGMDFADAMHLASCENCDAFATFDRKLVATARKAKAIKVRAL
jgi:predicted nucleic-acid-binding protein